ncbi:MAG: plasmid pRiA4b ORF-3 family protein [Lachnospiraceae bacterium]|nr:plasmid pRiA4b ORF-3 family protein [Lachnospiraceae bacterium]
MRMESEKLWNALRPSEEAVNACMGYEVSRLDYKYVDEPVPDFESLEEGESEEEEIRGFLDAYDYFMTHPEEIWADHLLPAERDPKVYRLHIELDLSPIGQTQNDVKNDMQNRKQSGTQSGMRGKMQTETQNGSSTFGVDPDIAAFLKTAKAEKGISRDILVPGNMTLRALHFAIQRVFGLMDQHHHNFALTEEDFASVTAGRLGGYLDLCGILFRFPDIWPGDAIRTEEYDARKSYKAWERKKYCAPFQADSIGDTWFANVREREKFVREHPDLKDDDFLDDLMTEHKLPFVQAENFLAEDLTLEDLMLIGRENRGLEDIYAWKAEILGREKMTSSILNITLMDETIPRLHRMGVHLSQYDGDLIDLDCRARRAPLGSEDDTSEAMKEDGVEAPETLPEDRDEVRKSMPTGVAGASKSTAIDGDGTAAGHAAGMENISELEKKKRQIEEVYHALESARLNYANTLQQLRQDRTYAERMNEQDISVAALLRSYQLEEQHYVKLLAFLFEEYDVHPIPFFGELRYLYDYGDGWEFRITVAEEYERFPYVCDTVFHGTPEDRKAVEEMAEVYALTGDQKERKRRTDAIREAYGLKGKIDTYHQQYWIEETSLHRAGEENESSGHIESYEDDDYDEGDYEDDYEDDYFDDFDEDDCDENDEDADYENYRIYRETCEYNLMKEVISSNMVDKRTALDRFRYRDSGNREVEEELRKTLAEIDVKGRPRCVAVDGLNPVENVGGVAGLRDFLAAVNGGGKSAEAKQKRIELLAWARTEGWTGRKSKAVL